MSGNDNPGNFANRPKEEVQDIVRKGGQLSHSGGFASMDPDKQVSIILVCPSECFGYWRGWVKEMPSFGLMWQMQREIASKGGQASSGSFEPGSEKAREAGAKGGRASGGDSD